jgi:hypothetical protein
MNSFSNHIYSTQTIIIKTKFRKNILECITSTSNEIKISDSLLVDFFTKWKHKSNNDSNFSLSIVLQLLLSPNIQSKIATLEHYINQLNYNNELVIEFINDFLVYYSIHIY